jgi:hypothetical protein
MRESQRQMDVILTSKHMLLNYNSTGVFATIEQYKMGYVRARVKIENFVAGNH